MSVEMERPEYRAAKAPLVNRTYLVPFYVGDGSGALLLSVSNFAEFLRGADGTCAFCHGDPCADESPVESLIGTYFARSAYAESCPCCKGRPT